MLALLLKYHDIAGARSLDRSQHGLEEWKVGFDRVIRNCDEEDGKRQSRKILLVPDILVDGQKNIKVPGD